MSDKPDRDLEVIRNALLDPTLHHEAFLLGYSIAMKERDATHADLALRALTALPHLRWAKEFLANE
jgi:hypothetical protein